MRRPSSAACSMKPSFTACASTPSGAPQSLQSSLLTVYISHGCTPALVSAAAMRSASAPSGGTPSAVHTSEPA